MNPIISFRLTNTGAWGYRFYSGPQLIGTVSCIISHSSLVRIEAPGISWYSSFNTDTTIVPGISRHVKDEAGEDIYRIIYCQPGFYRMIRDDANVLVERRNGAYLFGNQGMPVTAMTERIEEWPWKPADAEPYFVTKVFEEGVSREFLMAILAFPALRFY